MDLGCGGSDAVAPTVVGVAEVKNEEGNKAVPSALSGELSLSPSIPENLANSLLLRYCTAACNETRLNLDVKRNEHSIGDPQVHS